MSIRELFNGILDTDISILIGIFFLIVFYLMWGGFIYEVVKNINDILDKWLDKKLDRLDKKLDKEYNSLFLGLMLFFPVLLIRLFPTLLLLTLGIIFLLLPYVLLIWYLD